jgi:Ca2+-binding EF-hand superfamily protein
MSASPGTSIEYLKIQAGDAPYQIVKGIIDVADVWDADGDGVLTASEACSAVLLISEIQYGAGTSAGESMGTLFAAIDEDGDGSISAQELYSFLVICGKLGRLTDEVIGMLEKEVRAHMNVSSALSSLSLSLTPFALRFKHRI